MTTIRRIDPSRNMARFYALAVQSELLGGWSVVREWGRIGRAGRLKIDPHPELAVAEKAALQIEARKRQRGYS
jgi:predicted DNA-binding WGR domain protein